MARVGTYRSTTLHCIIRALHYTWWPWLISKSTLPIFRETGRGRRKSFPACAVILLPPRVEFNYILAYQLAHPYGVMCSYIRARRFRPSTLGCTCFTVRDLCCHRIELGSVAFTADTVSREALWERVPGTLIVRRWGTNVAPQNCSPSLAPEILGVD